MELTGSVFITGGAGTLGRAILRRAYNEGWDCSFTVYSRDAQKHLQLKRDFPGVRTVLGDIADPETLELAMVGHNVVIHAAANKHIGACQAEPGMAILTNVFGSMNVAKAAVETGAKFVVGISTDKACSPVNTYGQTKALMEAVFLSMYGRGTMFSIARYGNVIGSSGSVVTIWEKQAKEGKPFTLTDPAATRFWLSEDDAVNLILFSIYQPFAVTVPLAPALDMGTFLAYVMGDEAITTFGRMEITGLNPGEKLHEELISAHEMGKALYHSQEYAIIPHIPKFYSLEPLTDIYDYHAYTSDIAGKLSRRELHRLLGREE